MAATSRPPPSKPLDLDLTIVSAKDLKNVNWKNGDLKPYAIFWVDPDRRLATKSDDSGSTRPVWNERFTLPLSLPALDAVLTLEIFHSKPSETPKPLVATLQVVLKDLPDPEDGTRIRNFNLCRPSGRPQGKIRLKMAIKERPLPPPPPPPQPLVHTMPDYFYSPRPSPPPPPVHTLPDYPFAPPMGYYYQTAPPPPRGYPPSMYSTLPPPPPSPSLPQYVPGYYSTTAAAPPLPPPSRFDRTGGAYFGSGGPSAPVDYSPYDNQRQRGGKMGFGTGLAVGAVAGALGGIALEEGLKYEEDKIAERVETNLATGDDYSEYQADY
ncbi:protein SRC2 homolog [Carica papaya]|uniref:protein SRC2 homolog n=1 Tax=Carica papaya TaxID=3649 RepID=UPI000B8CF01F|nr:protein SRC2 homolog [Carica papaya]